MGTVGAVARKAWLPVVCLIGVALNLAILVPRVFDAAERL